VRHARKAALGRIERKIRVRLIERTQETEMDEAIKKKILSLLDQHRIMTIATLRPDGWPQATTPSCLLSLP
jgi:hypothetical protein